MAKRWQKPKKAGRPKARTGPGTWHCLHPECAGKKPVTRKRNHRVKHSEADFQECSNGCKICKKHDGKY